MALLHRQQYWLQAVKFAGGSAHVASNIRAKYAAGFVAAAVHNASQKQK
jgi:hypothetical protein